MIYPNQLFLDLFAAKLLINTTNAIKVDNIIKETLVIPIIQSPSIALIRGLTRPNRIKKVNNTTT